MTVDAWSEGTTHALSETDWAGLCASFLGSGFRVDLPAGPDRLDAARHEADRIRRIADLVGATLSEADWEHASSTLPGESIEVVGGWPRTYAGLPTLWIASFPVVDQGIATATVLPVPWHETPTSGLPTFSRLADEVVLERVRADCGIWATADGSVVTSTAGPIVAQRADGHWATGRDVGSWLGSRFVSERRATADLAVGELATLPFLGVIRRAHEIVRVTYIN